MRIWLLVAFLLTLPVLAQNQVARAVDLLAHEKRKEAFDILEKAFLDPKQKDEAAELLTAAIPGETHEHPGFYASYLLEKNNPKQFSERELRWLRLAGDYELQKAHFLLAHERYSALDAKGSQDDKDYAHYKTAWVYLNEGKNTLANKMLVDLLTKVKGSKLRLSAAFDLGRFWGESKEADRPQRFFSSALTSPDERKEFYRGVQKALLLPTKPADRHVMRGQIVRLPEAQTLVGIDLEAKAPTRELACEKLDWASWPDVLAKVEGDGPFIMMTQCFSTEEGKLRPLKDQEKKEAYLFIDALKIKAPDQALHRARFLSNLNEFERACLDYDRAMSDEAQRKQDICEEALGVCSKGVSGRTEKAAFNMLQNTLACAKLDANSRALELVLALYDKDSSATQKFLGKKEIKEPVTKSLIPDLLYEKALKAKDNRFAKFIAETYLTQAGAQSAERRKSLEHYLSNTDSKTAASYDQLRKIYPLEKDGKTIAENVGVWLKAYQARASESPPAELMNACLAPARNSFADDVKAFCDQKMDLDKAWVWASQDPKWNCENHEALVLRSWTALEENRAANLAKSSRLKFLGDTYKAYQNNSFKEAHKILSAPCPGSFIISQKLSELDEIKTNANKKVKNINDFSKQLKWLKGKIEKMGADVRVSEHMFTVKKNQLAGVVTNLEQSLEKLKKEQPDAAATLDQFKSVFEKWKKDLK